MNPEAKCANCPNKLSEGEAKSFAFGILTKPFRCDRCKEWICSACVDDPFCAMCEDKTQCSARPNRMFD